MVLGNILNPSIRFRRLATSSFFIATFAASILTVSISASTILPCPANSRSQSRATLSDESIHPQSQSQSQLIKGQKVLLTRKGGWIQVDLPHSSNPNPTHQSHPTKNDSSFHS
ncbi:uncharacterized protein UTRI_10359 [Ustilago trichophora]|uniref:Uncharacterized protein n=1 Tax=Ustilago trichophora TaxID=86804 RepID=A0A5C3E9G7_9BASI|nr:uncharacterized protein UTRI_10359 [Ustilago trichophora]